MLQSEFEKMVGMSVSPQEYYHIEQVYMNSDLEKTEFCHFWMQMNKKRIKAAKEEAKKKEQESKLRDSLWEMIEKYKSLSALDRAYPASCYITATEKKLLEKAEIDTDHFEYPTGNVEHSMMRVLSEVGAYVTGI